MPCGTLAHLVLQSERQATLQGRSVSGRNLLVAAGAAFGLGAFRAEEMTESRRASHELASGRQLEAFRYGFFCFLHGKNLRGKPRSLRLLPARRRCPTQLDQLLTHASMVRPARRSTAADR